MDVEFRECGSTPEMSELIDSQNSLKLDDKQRRKYIMKNLNKQYNFTTDKQVKGELDKYKSNKKKKHRS